ncbi:hypothetical protein MAR_033158 [Mya arenaria]|uniref:Uncharacterized protein n=1 Tax=Mya arenaria TaxID=6604 RepID=A0ABY7GCB7_MYAAR|nr:hypothetical protein MAR_033158 [Mya arenaria]
MDKELNYKNVLPYPYTTSKPHPIQSPSPPSSTLSNPHTLQAPQPPSPTLSKPHTLQSPPHPIPTTSNPHPIQPPPHPIPTTSNPHPIQSPPHPIPTHPFPTRSSPDLFSIISLEFTIIYFMINCLYVQAHCQIHVQLASHGACPVTTQPPAPQVTATTTVAQTLTTTAGAPAVTTNAAGRITTTTVAQTTVAPSTATPTTTAPATTTFNPMAVNARGVGNRAAHTPHPHPDHSTPPHHGHTTESPEQAIEMLTTRDVVKLFKKTKMHKAETLRISFLSADSFRKKTTMKLELQSRSMPSHHTAAGAANNDNAGPGRPDAHDDRWSSCCHNQRCWSCAFAIFYV